MATPPPSPTPVVKTEAPQEHQDHNQQQGPTLLDLYRHPPPEPRTIGGSLLLSATAAAAPAGRSMGVGVVVLHSCNCRRSNCLKLYCECFAHGVYCAQTRGCHCEGCLNNAPSEETRRQAVEMILDRNPHGFRPKIVSTGAGPGADGVKAEGGGGEGDISKVEDGGGGEVTRHQKGCHCKRSHCRKRYCECFQAGIPCTEKCRCLECQNTEEWFIPGDSSSKPPPPPPSPTSHLAHHHHQPPPPQSLHHYHQHQYQHQQGIPPSPTAAAAATGPFIVDASSSGPGGSMHAAATAAAASAQAAQAAAAAAAHAARGPSALLPSVHRAKLQANAENLLRAMRPQMTEDLVMLMVNAAWEEGLASLKEQQQGQEGQPPLPAAGVAAVAAVRGPESSRRGRKRKAGDEGKEDGGRTAASSSSPIMEVDVDAELGCAEGSLLEEGAAEAEEWDGGKKGSVAAAMVQEEEEEGVEANSRAAPAPASSSLPASTAAGARRRQRRRQEVSVLMHLNAGLQRLVELVQRGKATGGGGMRGGMLGGGAGGGSGGVGSTYAYARRMV